MKNTPCSCISDKTEHANVNILTEHKNKYQKYNKKKVKNQKIFDFNFKYKLKIA